MGLIVMVVSSLLDSILIDSITTPSGKGMDEGLLVLGLVAFWGTINMLLCECFARRPKWQLLNKLARIPVKFSATNDDRQQPKRGLSFLSSASIIPAILRGPRT